MRINGDLILAQSDPAACLTHASRTVQTLRSADEWRTGDKVYLTLPLGEGIPPGNGD